MALTACTGGAGTSTDSTASAGSAPAEPGAGLLGQLRGGGVAIFFRHAATDRSQPDANERTGPDAGPVDFADCSPQRNLTDAGRADARGLSRERAPDAGEPNLVMSGHGALPGVLAPAVTLGEGEAAVYTLRGDDVVLLGQLTPREWADLG